MAAQSPPKQPRPKGPRAAQRIGAAARANGAADQARPIPVKKPRASAPEAAGETAPISPPVEAERRSATPYILLGAAAFAVIQTYSVLSPIILSFLLIMLLSLALNPVIAWMRGLAGGRKLATVLAVSTVVTVLALTGLAFFLPMKASFVKLSEQFPVYWERLQKPLIKMERQAVIAEAKLQAEVATEIAAPDAPAGGKPKAAPPIAAPVPVKSEKEPGSLRSGLTGMLQGALTRFTGVAFNATQILIVLVTVFFGVTFTLMNPRPVFGAFFALLPERRHGQALAVMRRVGEFAPGWAGSTLLGMLAIGLLVFLLMWPIFGFMDALALGLIAGVLEAVPYLGPILSAAPALLFALGEGGLTPVWVLFAYIGVQAMENNLIIPLIMSRGLKLHPVALIFSILLCVAAFGVLGVLVAAPMVAIVGILHDEIFRKRFLPGVTDAELDRLARQALREEPSIKS